MGAFGAFGKIPALGDFFRINVVQTFVTPWDTWLQGAMARARVELADRWLACYTTAPIWRFTLTAGLAGPSGAMGVLMPSVDRVGRHFPLTAVAPFPAGRSAVQAHLRATETFEALELIVLDALGDAMTREQLAERLQAVRPAQPAGPVAWTGGDRHLAVTGTAASDTCSALAALGATQRFRAPSIWTAVLDADSRLLVADGLPGLDLVDGLFDLQAAAWKTPAPHEGAPP